MSGGESIRLCRTFSRRRWAPAGASSSKRRSEERVEALNERLWTYADESFLPHGSARDGEPQAQPVYLTAGDDNPNGAALRVLLSGVPAAAFVEAGYERVALLFDGRDEEAVAEARREWIAVKAAGAAPSYWREGEDGGWARVR